MSSVMSCPRQAVAQKWGPWSKKENNKNKKKKQNKQLEAELGAHEAGAPVGVLPEDSLENLEDQNGGGGGGKALCGGRGC